MGTREELWQFWFGSTELEVIWFAIFPREEDRL